MTEVIQTQLAMLQKRKPPRGRNVPQLPTELWSIILSYKTEAYRHAFLDECESIGLCPCFYCHGRGRDIIYGFYPNQYCERVLCLICDLDAPPECGARCNCGYYDSDDSYYHPEHYM